MRLAVLADIHGNLPALEAVMADMATRRVDRVVDLGDCVSGPLWPAETLARLRADGWDRVRGNHDRVLGDDPASLSRTDAFAFEQLDPSGRAWLRDLPVQLDLGNGIVAFHACPDDDDSYLAEEVLGGRLLPAPEAAIAARLAGIDARLMLAAHSHQALLIRLRDGRWLLNPGSVGCPAYDDPTHPPHVSESGSPAARYAIVTFDGGTGLAASLTAELLSIPYDHAAAAGRAEVLGRPDWAVALATGRAGPR